jgi:uncharacterized membrane protein
MTRIALVLPHLLAGLAVAAVTHLASVLLVPHVAPADATQRIVAGMETNRIEVLPPAGPDQMPFPFADPAVHLAACRYDIAADPVLLRLRAGEHFASLTLVGPGGRVLYSLTDRAAVRGTLDIRLLTREQRERLEDADRDDEPVQEIRLTLRETAGLAVFKAFAPWPSLAAQAEDTLMNARCEARPIPE